MRVTAFSLALVLPLVAAAAPAEDAAATAGKQRAAVSPLQWDVHEARHPVLGAIRFAHLKSPIASPVGGAKVYSNAYVSCATKDRTVAIELTNQTAPDDPGGLKPAAMPRLVCMSPAGGTKTVQDILESHWQVSAIGDAMARGLDPAKLRACMAIGIVEEVTLPKGWMRPTAAIQFEILPYAREVDSVFADCGEKSAYAPATGRAFATADPTATIAQEPAKAAPAPHKAAPAANPWRKARTIAGGHTNVRAAPNTHSSIVARLDPGAQVLVEPAGGAWWRARPRTGGRFQGYIREDRLVLE